MSKIIVKKWLADKKALPISFEGKIVRETQKAYQIEITDCSLFCKAFKDFQEDAEDNEWASDPCHGCLSRYGHNIRTEWFPKSQVEVHDK